MLAFYGGRTYAEVAVLLGVPLGTLKGRIRDGLARLRRDMQSGAVPPADSWSWPESPEPPGREPARRERAGRERAGDRRPDGAGARHAPAAAAELSGGRLAA
jgi:hypothetical protein